MDVNNNNKNGNGGANNPPDAGNGAFAGAAAKTGLKKWRAKRDCIYLKGYVTAGTVVEAAEMKNANFEEAKD